MSTTVQDEYGAVVDEYMSLRSSPWVEHVELPTIAKLIEETSSGTVRGKRVLDAACGDGLYTRFLRDMGAKKVVGLDLTEEMIRLAESKSSEGIDYFVGDVRELSNLDSAVARNVLKEGPFDIVTAGYLLNYSPDEATLSQMFEALSSVLKPGGAVIGLNNNPFLDRPPFPDTRSYGVQKMVPGHEDGVRFSPGTPIKVSLLDTTSADFPEVGSFTNYWLPPQAHYDAARRAGLALSWHSFTNDWAVTPGGTTAEEYFGTSFDPAGGGMPDREPVITTAPFTAIKTIPPSES